MRLRLLLLAAMLGSLLGSTVPAHALINGQPDNGAHPMVGELLFYLPDENDPRFDDPGAWGSCTGTLVDADTVVTAGHCTYGVGRDRASTLAGGRSGSGGTDAWFTLSESNDIADVVPPAQDYAPDDNAGRYAATVAALDASADWHRATAIPHSGYVDIAHAQDVSQIPFHDLGVLELHGGLAAPVYGRLPAAGLLDDVAKGTPGASFTVVGYGLTEAGPNPERGVDARRTATVALMNLNGVNGVGLGEASEFSKPSTGGVCSGDSGGPIFQGDTTVITAVVSFTTDSTCSGVTGGYRLDQPDDLTFLGTYVN